jgi:hypothetical protein
MHIVARLLVAWAGALAFLVVVSAALYFLKSARVFWEGIWLVGLLFISSAPLAALASLICLAFPRSISQHPFRWTLSALAAISVVAFGLAGAVGLIYSLIGSFPAAAMFLFSMRRWPIEVVT